jgi:hypothetical protein
MRRGRVTTGVLLWLVAAAAATAVGMTAVSAIGTDIFGGGSSPLSESEVDAQLRSQAPSTTTEPTTTPSPPPTSSPPPAGRTVSTRTAGGTVISRCEAGGVRVLQATPAQGFLVDDEDDGEDDGVDDHPSVKFRAGEREIEVRLRCANGAPVATVEDKD